ncbi:MAG: helix-turn-helix transcriptional regulator [Deltaproteobacteria bacterium]|nr:helix-turn-helix transcriptional regulator [Deltaproteobacteria bacterium]MBI4373260.1 helix-turn-helix transcriptional regulator [Deltaproteobacteria bacterium]
MNPIARAREEKGLSQRRLAALAGISFRTLQLLESGRHDPQVSTLQKIATALGYSRHAFERSIDSLFQSPPDSVVGISESIREEGEGSWKSWLFNFVDAFRTKPKRTLVDVPPLPETPVSIKVLLASTVETLCDEVGTTCPEWCQEVPPLAKPWFVSGMESLKAAALVESPVHFRKRNLFVLENFLRRV